ncbi:MAG: hypothetical protein QXD34_01975 [Candidatus Bathyarchaeia archaeon]|nr:hypothetical protein [Candidatus Bathyarchaeota archaeon]
MYFDLAMPLTLFVVTVVVILLHDKTESKLKRTFEEREFKVKDAILLVAAISVAVSVIVFIPQLALMIFFLFAYSLLLFIFTYLFSDVKKAHAKLFCIAFSVVSFTAATVCLFSSMFSDVLLAYGAAALYSLCGLSFIALVYEENRRGSGARWYLATMPPVLFLALYVFFNMTPIWFPYLLSMFGLIFAVLITLYIGSLFTWKSTLVFAGLLTFVDIVLVLVTRTMVSAATHVSGLRLPMLVVLPTLPQITINGSTLFMSLGLGDLFFAGLLAVQMYKKFGRTIAFLSAAAMSFSFLIFEAFILNFRIRAFPGTLMIICGWLPIMFLESLKNSTAAKQATNPTGSLL